MLPAMASPRTAVPPGQRPLPFAPRTIEQPPLSIRAAIGTANDEERTVEVTFTTDTPVERYDWATGQRFLETLSMDPAHVRLGRLNDGGPVLDAHSAWSVSDQLGAVVPGSVSLKKKEARATIRFSMRDAVTPIWQDVRDGILRSVSVGYRVYRYEETAAKTNGNKLPLRKAIDWEPFEVSMVPIPADAGAKTRGERPADTSQCEITPAETDPSRTGSQKETTMREENRSEFLAEDNPLGAAATPAPATPPPAVVPNERDMGSDAERERIQGILLATRAARLPQSFADTLIADAKMTLVRAQARVFEEMNKRGADSEGPGRIPAGDIRVGDDPLIHSREGVKNALLHRAAPELRKADGTPYFTLDENGRRFRGLSLLDIGRAILNARGVRTSHLSKMDLAAESLGLRAGMHTTSDFAELLADVANKTLRAAYEAAPQTWLPIARRVTVPDFKPVKQLSLGDAPALLAVAEHGEYTRGTIAESKEQFTLASYGRIFAITRKALVNDDLGAFSRVAMLFGRAARNLESDLVWAEITNNAAMGDGVVLFHANHANLAGAAAAISVDTIGAGRAAMRKQTGLDGETLLNVSPRYLIVPAAKETIADQFVSTNLVAAQGSNVNPFAGRLAVIAEPRLDANSTTAWYLAASPDQVDMILYGTLQDQDGPRVESRIGFDIDGVEIKAAHDFVAKVIDHRGLFKNAGA